MGGQITIGTDEKQIWIENICKALSEEELKYIFELFEDGMRFWIELERSK